MRDRLLAAAGMAALISLAACATPADRPGQGARVFAALETPSVGTRNADAADDPAIWSGPETTLNGRRVTGFVAGTDKKAGLYIYGPEGAILQFLPDGLLNNVDVATLPGASGEVVLGASDRTPGRAGVALFRFDPVAGGAVARWGSLPLDLDEPYGFCMRPWRGELHAFVVGKDGQVRQLVISSGPDGQPRGREVRRFAVGSISEGCAIDADNAALYLNEEGVGVWRYGLDPASGDARTRVQAVDGERLTADVEGAAILSNGAGSWLIASSQGDSAFAVWRIGAGDPVWVGRFAVHAGPGGDEVTGTDGLDAHGGPFGAFPEGVVVVQDDINDGGQNFKYIDWRDIRRALAF
ncbi:phytase [Brevundimonas sp.]|uniref:phytase n=1 Tax=Brevundimonas sp. TaxID=1871086 RepID=UPI002737A8E5|nr:phytase [Brevundimonas sp.]MDP3802296.1 phytase [Brevundimonas sp.]